MLRTVRATRYVTPLREGGSLPAIVEADDDGTYVLKFRGAGQGPKALIAELVAGEVGRALGLPVPEIVLMELDSCLGRSEPDPEIQALLKASAGLNLALDYLPGALGFDPSVRPGPDGDIASDVVWFDSYVTNVDRTARNTNILLWHRRLWLIDHGASLYFHHTWQGYLARSRDPFKPVASHVLLPFASALAESDARLATRLTSEVLRHILDDIPEPWLEEETGIGGPGEVREAYLRYLLGRLEEPRPFVEEAQRARA
jgi:hypothetical protein